MYFYLEYFLSPSLSFAIILPLGFPTCNFYVQFSPSNRKHASVVRCSQLAVWAMTRPLKTFRKNFTFGRSPNFVRLSFWKEQRVEEDEYGALMEW